MSQDLLDHSQSSGAVASVFLVVVMNLRQASGCDTAYVCRKELLLRGSMCRVTLTVGAERFSCVKEVFPELSWVISGGASAYPRNIDLRSSVQ